jgi:hypothetical protein
MTPRRPVLALVAILGLVPSPCLAAMYRTTNFVVNAPTPQLAQAFGQWAEYYRKEKAQLWLGHEMPNWGQPCPLHVTITMDGPSGATTFQYARDASGHGFVADQDMKIQGPLDRLIYSVLPHEITHTVFAYYFRCPLPRWSDEGGSVLSEDDLERERHDKIVRQILNSGQQIRLRNLFPMREYPRDVMCLYAQGYSVVDYLVKRSDRQKFLQFIAYGMQNNYNNWDNAARSFYGHNSIEELEGAWLKYLRDTKGQPHMQLAQNRGGTPTVAAAGQTVVRLTVPPVQPLQPTPVYRGQAPEQEGPRWGPAGGAPRYLPDVPAPAPAQVHLGQPQFGPFPGQEQPTGAASPIGYSR